LQTTEDSRKGKKSSRTARKENGERGPKADEKGTKQNWCKTVLTETRHQWQCQ